MVGEVAGARLLFGTALASSVLAAGLLGPGPALAQTIIETQSLPFGDSQTTTNSSKRTTTLQTIIPNLLLAPANVIAGSNPSPADPVQLIDFTRAHRSRQRHPRYQ